MMKTHIKKSLWVGFFTLVSATLLSFRQDIIPASKNETITLLPYTVTGVVKDAKGKPIAGAMIRIENDWSYYDVKTDANGRYTSPKLRNASYKVVGWYTTTYKGQKYTLRLGMANELDYEFVNVEKGAARNFIQQISGIIPDQEQDDKSGMGWFGMSVSINNGTGSIYGTGRLNAGDYVALTFVPTGPLLDGSTTGKIDRPLEILPGNESQLVNDIPIGEYEVRAYVSRNGAWKQLLIGTFSSQKEHIVVAPKSSGYGKGTYQNGLSTVGLYVIEP